MILLLFFVTYTSMDNSNINNHHSGTNAHKLNIRKRVQRVLYSSTISSADDDGTMNNSAEAPLPSVFEIESDYNNTTTTTTNSNPQSMMMMTMMKHGSSNNNHTSTTSSSNGNIVSISANIGSGSSSNGTSRFAVPLLLLSRPLKALYRGISLWTEWVAFSSQRCWMILIVAIFIEIYATTLMKIAVDSKNVTKTLTSTFLYIISLLMFGVSLRQIDVSVAYATWTAVGTATVAIFGILLFGESYTRGKLISLIFIITGVIGLNLSDHKH